MNNLEANKNKLKDFIENTTFVRDASTSKSKELDAGIKEFFRGLTDELFSFEQSRYKDIEAKVFKSAEKKVPAVTIALIEDSEKKDKNFAGLFPVCVKDEPKKVPQVSGVLKNVFLNDDYDTLKKKTGDFTEEKSFKGTYCFKGEEKEFEYYLKFDDSYLSAQELINRVNRIYSNDYPVLYNPFATKYFKILSKTELPEVRNVKDLNIQFRFKENDLNVIENADLYWNVKVEGNEMDYINSNSSVPYGKEIKYLYEFPQKEPNCFYIPNGNDVIVYDYSFESDRISVWINLDHASFTKIQFTDLDLEAAEFKVLSAKNRIFSNLFESPLKRNRILTKMDVEYAIRPFRFWRNMTCEVSSKELSEDRLYLRYSNKYIKDTKSLITPVCSVYLKFTETEDSESVGFKCDYVNFVLNYLHHFYPEIDWIGGM